MRGPSEKLLLRDILWPAVAPRGIEFAAHGLQLLELRLGSQGKQLSGESGRPGGFGCCTHARTIGVLAVDLWKQALASDRLDQPSLLALKMTASDEILTVRLVTKDGGDFCVRCPHCKNLIGVAGESLAEVKGEQYQHRNSSCGGWLEVAHDARFVSELKS